MAGSNDLNMLLKAQVVKIRAELDVKGSLPKIKEQIREISKKLEKNPVKLQVRLDYKLTELRKQMNMLQTSLNTAKTLKPIKIKVDIDVKGSAKKIKEQLREVNRVVDDFNKKYGDQIRKMEQQSDRSRKAINESVNIPASASAKNYNNIKQYNNALKETEKIMRSKVPQGQGLFSSTQFKDAQGNLLGFVAQLERANGVVEKVRYDWDSKSQAFTPINRQTVDTMQKHTHKATQSLRSLDAEIKKLDDGVNKNMLRGAYKSLENRAELGKLSQDAVKNLQIEINQEKSLQQQLDKTNSEYVQRQKLLRDIRVARDKGVQQDGMFDVKPYQQLVNNVKQGTKSIGEQRLELQKLNDANNKNVRTQKEIQENTKKRLQLARQLRAIERQTPSSDQTSQRLIGEIKLMAQRANSGKEWIAIQKRMNDLHHSNANARELRQSIDLQDRLAQKIREVGAIQGRTSEQTERHIMSMRQTALRGYADLERMYYQTNKQLQTLRAENKKAISEGKVLLAGQPNNLQDAMLSRDIKGAVNSRDVQALQEYIGGLYKGKVETVRMEQTTDSLGRAVDRMRVKMAGTGKTVKSYVVDLDRANGELRQVQQGLDYNANRNLGVFEQLRIAMARVPVWMTAMTAFYGSIRTVQAFTREILEVDKALTELRRVASDDLSIERVFRGSVDLSKELGNNVHDVMQTMNDFARTFGDFNERQLLAITNTATLMSNVSELGAQDAGETLIATMNAFNIEAEESIRIVDAFNEVDNNFAVSTQQLSEGMSKTASTAETFGVTMEESVGHITAISSVTQESGKIIGNSLKTIYSRITTMDGAKSALDSVNIAIEDMAGNVRPVQDILADLGAKWYELTDSQRQNLSVTLAGRYQLSRFLALMNNWDTSVEATTTALTSQGSAMRENDAYLESFEARINMLKVGFTDLALSVGDAVLSDGLFAIIELLRTMAQATTDFMNKFGALPALFLGLSAVLGKFGYLGKLHGMFSGFLNMFTRTGRESRQFARDMKEAELALKGTATATTGVEGAMNGATGATRTFGGAVKGVLASTGVGLLFVGLGIALENVISKYADAKREAEEFEKQQSETINAFREFGASDGLNEMIDQYGKLHEMSERTTEQEQEYQKLRANLVNNFPSFIDSYDAEGEAILKNIDVMKDEVTVLEDISRQKAEVTKQEFRTDIEKEAKGWQDLTKKIKETSDEIAKLSKNDGIETKEYNPNNRVGLHNLGDDIQQGGKREMVNGQLQVTIDHTKEIAKQELKLLEHQQKRANALQDINKRISDQTLAYMEVDGVMSKLSESQIRAIEDYSMSHTKSISKRIEELESEGATQEDIANFLESKGESIANKGNEIGKAYRDAFQDIFNATDGSQTSMNDVRTAVDAVSDSLDANFYKWKDTNVINDQLKDLTQISYDLKTAGVESFDSYIGRVMDLGYSTEEATVIVGNLAKEQQNADIYQQAMANGFEETTEAIEDMNSSLLDAIDLTSTLLGAESSAEMEALESNLALIMLYNEELGKGAKEHWEYNEAVKGTATSLGVSEETLMKNAENIAFLTKVTGELNPTISETGDSVSAFNELSEEQADKLKNVGVTQDELLQKYIEHKDWSTAILDVLGLLNDEKEKEAEKNKENAEATKEDTEAKKENKDATDKQAEAIENLDSKFQTFKDNANVTNRSAWIDTMRTQLDELDGKIKVTRDEELGGFKLVMADGSESEWLNTVKSQLDELGIDVGVVEDEAGELKLVLNDGTGSTTLTTMKDDAGNLKVALDDTIGQHEILKESAKTLPNDYSQIDFTELFSGLETTTEKVQFLSEILQGVWENAQEILALEEVFETLSGMATNLEDAIRNMFDSSSGDLEDLKQKAIDAKGAIDDLSTALSNVRNKSRDIPTNKFDGFINNANDAKSAVNDFKGSLRGLPTQMLGISGASLMYATSIGSINNATLTAVGMIGMYATTLSTLSNILVVTTSLNNGLSVSQRTFAQAMSTVINIVQSYDASITNATNNISTAYMKMAISIAVHTAKIIIEYKKHGFAVRDLVDTTDDAWKDIVRAIITRGSALVSAIRKISSLMKDTFKSGMDSIVDIAESLPARIGSGVRSHMQNASSSMDAVAKDMVKRFKSELGIHSPSRVFEELGGWVVKGLANGLTGGDLKSLGKDVFSDFGGGVFDSMDMIKAYVSGDWSSIVGNAGAGVQQWAGLATKALQMTGQYSDANLQRLLYQMQTESGGNVKAINLWDSNAKAGIPSKGLMQVIDPTFNAYKMPGFNNIWSPLDNMLASIRYAVSRYGSLARAYRGVGYEEGGFIEKEHLAMVGEGDKREVVIPLEQHENRAVSLWQQAGEELGLIDRKRRGHGGFGANSNGGFGALSGEGGSADGGGGSGTSGVVQPSIYEGGVNLDGDFQFMALNREALFSYNKNDRKADAYSQSISMIETRMSAMTENTLKYRNALKQVIFESQKLASIEKKELNRVKGRQKSIEKQIKSLGQTSKHTEKQRKKYNELQREYEQNISKIQSLEKSVEETNQKIKNTTTEIFVDWVDQIIGNYERAIASIEARTDDIDFKLDVLELTDPDNIKEELKLLSQRAKELGKQEATTGNLVNKLQKEYDKAVKKYGKSSKEAKKVKEELDSSKESLEDITLEVLKAEKDILDTRGTVADRGISQLKDYYGNMKSMALEAIEFEKRELQKAHEAKMKMYDEEIDKVNSVYDEKIKSMDKEKEQAEHQEQLDEKNANRAELVNKISLLSRDTSVEGRKRVAELQAELQTLDKEIASFMRERQDKLLREAMEEQKNQQIAEIEARKEAETEEYDSRVEELDQEAGDITKHYDSMLNDEKRWADMRNNFIEGSFSTLTQELEAMSKQLSRMTQGNFNNLTSGFYGFSDEIKQEFADMFGIDIGNMNFNNEGLLKDAIDAGKAVHNAYTGSGSNYTNPSQTTGKGSSQAIHYDAQAPTAPASKPKTNSGSSKKPKVGSKVKVSASNARAFIDSYGREVKPWADQAKSAGVKYGQSMYLVNSKNGYGALSKTKNVKDAIAWVKMNDLVGLRSGGYTGTWAGQGGKVAMLHKEEQVFHRDDTRNLLDASKLLRAMGDKIPKIKAGSITDKLATAGSVTNVNYGDIYLTVHGGDKKKTKDIAKEFITELKKKGH